MTNSLQNYSNKHLISIKNNFHEELRNASVGHKSSLSWIKSPLPSSPIISQGIVQAIVIGGSNFEFATVNVNNHDFEIVDSKKGALPILNATNDLITIFEANYNPDVEAVAINFAFPLKPIEGSEGILDGIFLHGTKEHTLNDLIGKPVGQFIKDTIYKKDIPVTVANDTVCLTLSGSGAEQSSMILGTGFNIGLNQTSNGVKSVINLEAGGFGGVERTKSLEKLDQNTENKGEYLLEKSVAGRYLIEHFNLLAIEQNPIFTPIQSAKELSILAANKEVYESKLANEVLCESAKIIASIIAGLYEYLKRPQKLELIIEGSLFWKGYGYTKSVKEQLSKFEIDDEKIVFKQIDNSSLKGAIHLLNVS